MQTRPVLEGLALMEQRKHRHNLLQHVLESGKMLSDGSGMMYSEGLGCIRILTKAPGDEISQNPRMKDLGWHGWEPRKDKKQGSHITRFVKINHYGYSVSNWVRGV